MKKTKHNPPRKAKSNFIEFSNVQRNYLTEVRTRQIRELNEALEEVYRELGVLERIAQAPFGKYKLRPDFSGVDILPVKPGPQDEPPPPGEDRSGKDN